MNFERAPLELPRAINSKRERERSRREALGSLWEKKKIKGNLIFLVHKFWQTIKEIQALDSPEN